MVSFFAGVGGVATFLALQAAIIYVGWYFSANERALRGSRK